MANPALVAITVNEITNIKRRKDKSVSVNNRSFRLLNFGVILIKGYKNKTAKGQLKNTVCQKLPLASGKMKSKNSRRKVI